MSSMPRVIRSSSSAAIAAKVVVTVLSRSVRITRAAAQQDTQCAGILQTQTLAGRLGVPKAELAAQFPLPFRCRPLRKRTR